MRIFYRGYVINGESTQSGCTVEGRRPERREVAFEDNPRAAMRWIDGEIFRRKVADAGWFTTRLLSA